MERMSEDEKRTEFRELREQAHGSLRALAFRGITAEGKTQMPAATLDARIMEVSILVNDLFRDLVPGGITFEWTRRDPM